MNFFWVRLLGILIWGAGVSTVFAKDISSEKAPLSRQPETSKEKILQKVQAFLNNFKTLKAHFIQINPDNSTRSGTLFWLKPLHLKFLYEGKPKLEVYCDSDFFSQVDEDGASSTSVSNTPASILLKKNLNLSADAHVVIAEEKGNGVIVELASKDDKEGASLTLVFETYPESGNIKALKQWRTKDAAGRFTDLVLHQTEFGIALTEKDFEIK